MPSTSSKSGLTMHENMSQTTYGDKPKPPWPGRSQLTASGYSSTSLPRPTGKSWRSEGDPEWDGMIDPGRDARLRFDEETHTYYVDGRRFISVTQLVGKFFPKFDAQEVASKILRSPKMDDPSYKYFRMTGEEIVAQWENLRNESAEAGTYLHACIDAYARQSEVVDAPPEFRHFLDLVDEFEFEPIRSEWAVFDEEYEVAGTLDMLFRYQGEVFLFDWKRTEEMKRDNRWESGFGPVCDLPNCNFWKYALQQNIYAYILKKRYGICVSGARLVVLHPDNPSYEIHPVPRMFSRVETILKAHKGA